MISFTQYLLEKDETDLNPDLYTHKDVTIIYSKRRKNSMKLFMTLFAKDGTKVFVSSDDYITVDVPDMMSDIHQNYVLRALLNRLEPIERSQYNQALNKAKTPLSFVNKYKILVELGSKGIAKKGSDVNADIAPIVKAKKIKKQISKFFMVH